MRSNQPRPGRRFGLSGLHGGHGKRRHLTVAPLFAHNLAIAHVEDAAGNGSGLGVVGDHEGGLTELLIGAHQHLEHCFGVLCVKVAGGLVGENDGRPRNERAGDGDTLLLAATQLGGAMLEAALDGQKLAEMVEVVDVERAFAAAHGPGDLDIAHGGEGGEQIELLEDKADAIFAEAGALSIVKSGEVDAIDDDAALGGLGKAAEQVKERGFS